MGYAQQDYIIHYVALSVALVLVAGGWAVLGTAAALGIRWFKNLRIADLDPTETGAPGNIKYLLYAVSFLFWPAALAFGIFLMINPRSARAGAMCLYILLIYTTLSVLLACGLVAFAGFVYPEWFMDLLGT